MFKYIDARILNKKYRILFWATLFILYFQICTLRSALVLFLCFLSFF